ncbi:MAG: MBOAT family protein [bacterium]|nr:MBOAT family protein [bacterium]
MLFNTFSFAVFFVAVYLLYVMLMGSLVLQNLLLLAASYFFYGWWDWRFLGLILLSTVIDFLCGREIDRRKTEEVSGEPEGASNAFAHSPRKRRGLLAVSIVANLGILGFFKYFDFFAGSCAEMLGAVGFSLQPRLLEVILPVGISFYTFQTLSYTIDVYRGQIRAHTRILDFAVFVAFFPQLVAGPILRAREFLPQVCRRRRFNLEQAYEGGYLVFWGLFKKMVIADGLAGLVDGVFGAEVTPHGGAVLVGVYAFAVQIYCDFSGYTDIARGVAKMMGFEIPLNFNLPYFARNPAEFWRRWHISLSSWLRDYLYIPLGGNRKGPRRTCINLALTMVLGGLWHGAAWTFVLWGVYQGALLVVHKALKPWLDRADRWMPSRWKPLVGWLTIGLFFQFTCLGWLIFRAESVQQIPDMLWAIFTSLALYGSGATILAVYALPLLLMQWFQYVKSDLNFLLRWPAPVRGLAYCTMFYGLVVIGVLRNDAQSFIYFQF